MSQLILAFVIDCEFGHWRISVGTYVSMISVLRHEKETHPLENLSHLEFTTFVTGHLSFMVI